LSKSSILKFKNSMEIIEELIFLKKNSSSDSLKTFPIFRKYLFCKYMQYDEHTAYWRNIGMNLVVYM